MDWNIWKCGDPDSFQYLRVSKENPNLWEAVEMRGPYPGPNDLDPGKFGVVHTVIDLDDYSDDEIIDYIKGYGYDTVEYIEEQYGEMATQVIVECIFECLEDDFELTGSEKDCERYIKNITGGSVNERKN